jgi:uncharacterized UBP type Zn finger protein
MAFMNLVMTGNPNAINTGTGGMPQQRPPSNAIQVTQAEMDSITNLESLGFSKQAALEALRACGGNEEHAANFLFESAMEDE